jgi:hypothetical protein
MKKKEIKKLQLSRDTLRQLTDNALLEQAAGGQPTTTVQTKFPSCTAC